MDPQYYRKSLPKSFLPEPLRKLLKNNWTWVILGGVTFVVAYSLYNTKGVLQHIRLSRQRQEMLAKLQTAQIEQNRLKEYSKALDSDPKVIEKVAREQYGMIKEGETIYKVRKEK